MIFIQPDFSSLYNANTQVIIDVRDEHIAKGVFGDLQGTFALPEGFVADRWYYGWWGKETLNGPVALQWRLDDAGPPDWPLYSILTAARTRMGPAAVLNNLPNPHAGLPCIWRWYYQWGRTVRTRGMATMARAIHYDANQRLKEIEFYNHPDELPDVGIAPLIPANIVPVAYIRSSLARPESYTGTRKMVQAAFGMWPNPSWDDSAHPVFRQNCQGYAGTEPPGDVHDQDWMWVPHKPGTNKIQIVQTDNTQTTVVAVSGWELSSHILYVPEPEPEPEPVPGNDEFTMLFVNRDGSTFTDTSVGGAGSPHATGTFGAAKIFADHPDFDLAGDDFTIEIVCTTTVFNSQMTPASQWEGSGGLNRAWISQVNADGSVAFTVYMNGGTNVHSVTAPAGTFTPGQHKIGLQRGGNTLSLFVDDVLKDSEAISGYVDNSTRAVMIGGLWANGGGAVNQPWPGTVEHLSIHRTARY